MARDGHTTRAIAAQHFLSRRTVEWHLGKVFTKLGSQGESARGLRAARYEIRVRGPTGPP
jgi:DNA-binding CsgD family transcriptional regulator